VIRRYAIGGAVGAIFYMEPVLTYDLDIFVELPTAGGGLLSLSQVYDYLRAQGYAEERECFNIEGVPVQFLPAFNPRAARLLRRRSAVERSLSGGCA